MKKIIAAMIAVCCVAFVPAALAQQTTGTLSGRITDAQGSAIPGVTVSGRNTQTGFTRTSVTDTEGIYRLTALPVGIYDIAAELQGFSRVDHKGIVVSVAQSLEIGMTMNVAGVQESITVSGDTPLIETRSSSVGGVVDISRIENLPLNGRQFANLAATIPGVGLGFHADPTKSSQFTPQINGGNGRNVNYQIDGGDNNDDTVGGLLQNYPLEAIQEFNFITQRFKAEYGRSNGGVMNIVTKSGTNMLHGSGFMLFRDRALNAATFAETLNKLPKQDYRRYQYGGSVGGPLVRDKAHYFGAIEQTRQDTTQSVNTLGLFPAHDGTYPIAVAETLATAKLTLHVGSTQYFALRYGRNSNRQPYAAGLRAAPNSWSTSTNTFDSINASHNWVLGGSKLNEFIFQYADFANFIPLSSADPYLVFPNGVTIGSTPNTPQSTEQRKFQFRDDLSWSRTGMGGLGHDFKAGVNWIHEPHLYITSGGTAPQIIMASNEVDGRVQAVTFNSGAADVNIPFNQYAAYIQDDWRVSARLTLNLGLRYDVVTGMPIDQSKNPNFQAMQAAGAAGRFANVPWLDTFGLAPRNDRNNIQPRTGFAFDFKGDGTSVVRGGWGIYQDFGYTNSNGLFAALDAAGAHGQVFFVNVPSGIVKADGTFFRASDPLSTIASQNEVNPALPPLLGQVISPRLEQPYTRQTNLGWALQLNRSTALTVDAVRVEGRDLNIRFRPNTRVAGGPRRLGDLSIRPNTFTFRTAVSEGESLYQGLIIGLRRRMTHGVDLSASYTLGKAESLLGTANDELDANNIQDAAAPAADVNFGPGARTDARHRVSVSAIIELPWGLQVSPFLLYRSALPLLTFEGIDFNNDGNVNDITPKAYKYTGLQSDGTATFEETGDCKTVNCSRRAPFSQLNVRVSKGFPVSGTARIDAIGEIFNVLGAKNPALPLTSRRLGAGGAPQTSFMQPTAFAGDFQQPEQRVGQIGVRFSF